MADYLSPHPLEEHVLAQKWLYSCELPSGRVTETYVPGEVEHTHRTRRDMMMDELAPLFAAKPGTLTALDIASHQEWFSLQLSPHSQSVPGIKFQDRHIASARLITECLGVTNTTFTYGNIETMAPNTHEPAGIAINFGLIYNVEKPIGALRRCREKIKRVLPIETQTTILDLEGAVHRGHWANTNYMHAYWDVFSGNPENIDGSASNIVFYLSPKGLVWVLKKLGFRDVEILPPPPGANQQLATGKRIMVAARL